MRRYAPKKSYEWNSSLAYVAGLIASDGCLSNDKRHINLTSRDIEQLETLKFILNIQSPIGKKQNGFGGVGFFIQFSNVALYDFLDESGITSAKSKTIQSVKVPDVYYGDFLRGYFDGDGCIYGFWDKRFRSSLMYYTEYTSASPKFLNWLQLQNIKMADVTPGRITPKVRAASLSYAKSDSQKLFMLMYHSPNLPALSRKYVKFVDFLRSDPYANKALYARVL